MHSRKTRFQELLEYFQIDQTDIVNKTGIPKSSISMYVNGQRKPRQDKLTTIADAYGVQESWLMGYDVPMFKGNENEKQKENLGISLGKLLSIDFDGVAELINIFREMSDDQKTEYLEIGKKMIMGKDESMRKSL